MSGYFGVEETRENYLGSQNWQMSASLLILTGLIAAASLAGKLSHKEAPQSSEPETSAAVESSVFQQSQLTK